MRAGGQLFGIGAVIAIAVLASIPAAAQLNQNCTVSVLNRTVQVKADGSWVLPNVPANFGQVKARATCVQNGVTTSGESAFFAIPANSAVNLPEIVLGGGTAIPVSLNITPGSPLLSSLGQTVQLAVQATYPDASTKDVTAASTGTNYTTSNPSIATISEDGLLTAIASGAVVIQASNDGATGMVSARILISGSDSDGDGIPDDDEIGLGLNPSNPVDAEEDFDRDNLSNRNEYLLGTDLRVADTDEDGLSDGDEFNLHLTNPLISDTDGDGIPDGIEVETGSNPLDPNSFDLSRALTSFMVSPVNFALTVSSVSPEASQQLSVTGRLIDDSTTLDLTSKRWGTSYSSNNLAVCNFGLPDGRVFAGSPGSCTITVSNSGFTALVTGLVRTFTPTSLSFVSIPGFANNVDVSGRYAYVAAGSTGLQVVDVADRTTPLVVASRDTPGNANDVVVVGSLAYVADGTSGLQVINVDNPLNPIIAGAYDTPGAAWDVAVQGNRAYVADGTSGLQVIDVTNPASPQRLGFLGTPGTAKGVDFDPIRQIAVVAAGGSGLHVANVVNAANPTLLSTLPGGDVRDVALAGNFAFLADYSRSFTSVDLTNPSVPVLRGSTPQTVGGLLQDVAVSGSYASGADVLFVNGVPIIDIANPAAPVSRTILDFRGFRDDNGTGIDMDESSVYLTAERGVSENGVNGDTRLYIGQYSVPNDSKGVAPTLHISSPLSGTTLIEGATVTVSVEASDDVGVEAVVLFVDEQPVLSDAIEPYRFALTVPLGTASLSLGATAIDFGSNVGVAQPVTLNVIPDPLTTVTGRIVDAEDLVVADATTRVFGSFFASSAADGRFSIANVPTIRGDIAVYAQKGVLSGRSPNRSPVGGGVTDVGDVAIFDPPVRLFPVEVSYTSGGSISIAAGDLNADGYLDLVVALYSAGADRVSILLGKGDGSFHESRVHRISSGSAYPRSVALADLNLDGRLDVITANVEGVGVSVGLGNGDGTFRAGQGFAAGNGPFSVAVGDLNEDTWPDVVVANYTSNDISVLVGNGDGTLQPQFRVPVGGRPRFVQIADVDNDGVADVVTANSQSNNVSVLLGNGTAAFESQRTFPTDTGPVSLAVSDVNRDGKPDLITANSVNSVSVLLGSGDGTFQIQPSFATGTGPSAIAAIDVNGDGRDDIVTANSVSNDASVLLGNGDGNFQVHQEYGAANTPQCLAVEDVNDDGRLDILMGNFASQNVSIVLGNGDGTYPTIRKYSTDRAPTSVALAHFNTDGAPDIVTAQYLSTVSLLPSVGDGTFGSKASYPAGNQGYDVAAADVNHDGLQDVIVASYWNHQLVVLLGNGEGTLQPQIASPASGSPTSLALADFNQDDHVDVVLGVGNSSGPLSVLRGNGDGTFQSAQKPLVSTKCDTVTAGDVNGDSRADIVCVNADGTFSILLGNGDATFQIEKKFSAGMRPWSPALGDINGDGRQDLVLGGLSSSLVSINLGNGDGMFQPPTFLSAGLGVIRVALGDLDGDGQLDIAVASPDSNDVSVLLRNEDGTFRTPLRFFAGDEPSSLAISDLDGDGHLDLVIANRNSDDVAVLLNQKR